jgi:signal recognition particle subunit SRP54
LDSDGKIFETNPSRLLRVASGSGAPTYEVEALLAQHKQFAQMIKKMGGPKGFMKGKLSNNNHNHNHNHNHNY